MKFSYLKSNISLISRGSKIFYIFDFTNRQWNFETLVSAVTFFKHFRSSRIAELRVGRGDVDAVGRRRRSRIGPERAAFLSPSHLHQGLSLQAHHDRLGARRLFLNTRPPHGMRPRNPTLHHNVRKTRFTLGYF